MPWLELSLRSTEAEQPRYERALEDVGALSVTLLDADADTPNERAILEPGVGQTPIWKSLVLTALFEDGTDALALLAALDAFDPGLDWAGASFRTVAARRRRNALLLGVAITLAVAASALSFLLGYAVGRP